MQYAYLPIRNVGITQGCNGSTSHLGTNAIDFGRSSTDKNLLYAPFDGTIVWTDKASAGNGIAFQSNEKVKFADGTEDYMTIITGHDNNPPALGKSFKQGEVYSAMGTAGNVPKHCHLEAQKGKFKLYTKIGVTSADGKTKGYIWPNTIEPYKILYVVDNCKFATNPIYNPYQWKKVTEVKTDYKKLYEEQKKKVAELQAKIDKIKDIVNE